MAEARILEEHEAIYSRIRYAMGDAETLSRYYGRISDRQQRWHQRLSVATIMLSVGGAIILLLNWPAWVVSLLFLALTLVASLMLVFDFSRRAETARIVSRQMRTVSGALRDLRTDRTGANLDYLSRKAGELEERMNVDTYVDLIVDDKLYDQCKQEADSVLSAEFGRA